MKTVLITGATSGIGRATARIFAKNNFKVVICGRREDRLAELQDELTQRTAVHTLLFDVSKKKQVEDALGSLPEEFRNIDVLINNAGNAHGLEPIFQGDLQDWDAMIDSNVKGLLYVSRAIMPQMVDRRKGHIINIGSVAGKENYLNGNVYCATKHAVDSITKSMRLDLNPYGIKVSAIHPGMVETEFSEVRFKGDRERAAKVYQGLHPLSADDVADVIHFMASRPAHINIADLVLLPTDQASATVLNRQ